VQFGAGLSARGRLRLLLASSSVAALLIGAGTPAVALAPCISPIGPGPEPGCVNAGTIPGIIVTGATVSGNIFNTNTGLITATGISVINHSTINGAILSSGTIEAGGISVDRSSTITGGAYPNYSAINVSGPTFLGGITNAGTLSGTLNGVLVGALSSASSVTVTTFGGGITNSGLITVASGGNGIVVGGAAHSGSNVTVSNFSGNISNSGTISAGNNGIVVGGGAGGEGGTTFLTISTFTGNIINSGTITAGRGDGILVGGTANLTSSTVTISLFSGNISNSGTISAGNNGIAVGGFATGGSVVVSTFSGGITNSGTITAGANGIFVGGVVENAVPDPVVTIVTFSNGITNSGTITAGAIGIFVGGTAAGSGNKVTISAFSGGISNGGVITAKTGILVGGNANTGGSVTISTFANGITNSGRIIASNYGIFVGGNATGSSSVVVSTFSGGITNTGTISAKTGIFVGSSVASFSGAIVNSGTISGTGGTAIDVSGANNAITINQQGGLIAGAIKLSAYADQLTITGGTIAGNIVGQGSDNITFAGSTTFTYSFTGINQVDINSGTVILNGVNSANNVDVIGGTLAGTGTLDPLLVTIHSGATFAPGTPGVPGTSMAITGNLAFQSGALYLVYVNPTTASFANVTGTASLAGTVNAVFTPGSYVSRQYTILTTTGGLGGTTFAGLSNTNLPTGATDSLSYSGNDVYLNLKAGFTQYTGLDINQQNVANALTNYFNTTGGIPAAFFGLSPNGLTRIDGEAATDAAQGAFLLMDQFLELMLDPFVDGRGGGNFQSGGGAAYGFAPEQQPSFTPDVATAYDAVLKAPPATTFDRRWTTWGAAFGGSNTTAGDATVGSHDSTAQIYGYAAGMDYHYSKDSVVGFALAGGGTNWGLSQGLGGGRSDAFQAGLYSATRWGPAYVAAALDASNYWMSTSRAALAGDQLNASFMAQGYGVRAEAGYRFAAPLPGTPLLGVTPYGALRALSFHSPSYSEADPSGGGFGLNYNSTTATDTRSELGARFDDPTIVAGMPLVLRGRLAWAHDWASNPAINATFETLPGASFTVNGARIPQDSALVSGGAQLFMTSRWSFLARAEGQFAAGSQTYAGSGTLRYSW
jgi:hypothetical protein